MTSKANFQREGRAQDMKRYLCHQHTACSFCVNFFLLLSITQPTCGSPTWQHLTALAFSPLAKEQSHLDQWFSTRWPHGRASEHPRFGTGTSRGLVHTSKPRALLQILRRAALRSCSFYITPPPSLAHLH